MKNENQKSHEIYCLDNEEKNNFKNENNKYILSKNFPKDNYDKINYHEENQIYEKNSNSINTNINLNDIIKNSNKFE